MKLRFFPLSAAASPPAYSGLELLATAVLLMRNDGRVSYANPAAENLFELSRPKLVGHTPRELFGECPALAGGDRQGRVARRLLYRAGAGARRQRKAETASHLHRFAGGFE